MAGGSYPRTALASTFSSKRCPVHPRWLPLFLDLIPGSSTTQLNLQVVRDAEISVPLCLGNGFPSLGPPRKDGSTWSSMSTIHQPKPRADPAGPWRCRPEGCCGPCYSPIMSSRSFVTSGLALVRGRFDSTFNSLSASFLQSRGEEKCH